jgi:hypothetical protein
MSTTDATAAVTVTATQLATLRASQLKEAAATLDRVAGEFSERSLLADVTDPGGEIAGAIRVVREDLDALEALGYGDDED